MRVDSGFESGSDVSTHYDAMLAKVVAWARARGAVVASDECYCDLGWTERWDPAAGGERVPSVLDPRVTGGDLTGVLAVCSASKRSNLAGYRAGFVAGDPVDLVDPDGRVVARGLVNFDADEIPALLGKTTRQIAAEGGSGYDRTVVHKDALVVMDPAAPDD